MTPPPAGAVAARGATVVLSVRLALYGAALAQSVIVARWIPPAEVGTFAFGAAVAAIVGRIKNAGAPEKLVRDTDAEFERSFPAALATQLWQSVGAFAVLGASLALLAFGGFVDPTLALVTGMLGSTLFQQPAELPAVAFFRRLDFVTPGFRQVLASAAAVVVTLVLAIMGWGVWALVAGQGIGVAATAVLFWGLAPEPLPLRPVTGSEVRGYLAFGLPVWGMGLLGAAAERGTMLAISSSLGLTALGYVHVAQSLTVRLAQGSQAVSSAIFPLLRAVRDDLERMRSRISDSNRIVAAATVPVGVGIALFASDLVPLLFGERWTPAVPFIGISCFTWATAMIGYASYLPFLARGDTGVPAAYGAGLLAAKLILVVPAVLLFGLEGFLAGMALSAFVGLALQTRMIRRIFPGTSLVREAASAVLATAAAVVAVRAIEAIDPLAARWFVVRFIAYAAVVGGGLIWFERGMVERVLKAAAGGFRMRS